MNGNSTRLPGEKYSPLLDGDTVVLSPDELRGILTRESTVYLEDTKLLSRDDISRAASAAQFVINR